MSDSDTPAPGQHEDRISSRTSTTAKQNKARASKKHLTNEDIDNILTWLEHSPNYNSVNGISGKTPIGKPLKTAIQGFNDMATFVNKRSKGRWSLSGRQMKERFGRYKKSYTTVRPVVNGTGFGITDDDRDKGITKVEHKRDSICHGYDRMECLYGHKPNVDPLMEADTGSSSKQIKETIDDTMEDERDDYAFEHQEYEYRAEGSNKEVQEDDDFDADDDQGDIDNAQLEDDSMISIPNTTATQATDTTSTLQRKRQSSQTGSATKRSKDQRKAPPSLKGELPSNNSLAKAFTDASAKKVEVMRVIEYHKITFERERLKSLNEIENKKQKQDKQKWDLDRDMELKKLQFQKDIEEKRFELEKRRITMEENKMKAALVQTALSSGQSFDDVVKLISLFGKSEDNEDQ
ncbi:hypothetical protein BGZ65_010250 [Modicella reniformis]|uniref:Uncharacterized protein n=1 Tax=Modicella reniformis TaxID=1440133 RepID=A0A9P6MEA0_9FUNG|nr:hypothetical protein BGZ65_010250 [Modicella reniformis]